MASEITGRVTESMFKKKCENCGRSMTRKKPSEARRKNWKFCSRSCKTIAINRLRRKGIDGYKKCESCGKKIPFRFSLETDMMEKATIKYRTGGKGKRFESRNRELVEKRLSDPKMFTFKVLGTVFKMNPKTAHDIFVRDLRIYGGSNPVRNYLRWLKRRGK